MVTKDLTARRKKFKCAPNYPIIKLKADHRHSNFHLASRDWKDKNFNCNSREPQNLNPTLLDTTTDATEAEIQRPAGSEFFVRTRRIDSDGYTEAFSKPERVTLNEPFVQTRITDA